MKYLVNFGQRVSSIYKTEILWPYNMVSKEFLGKQHVTKQTLDVPWYISNKKNKLEKPPSKKKHPGKSTSKKTPKKYDSELGEDWPSSRFK